MTTEHLFTVTAFSPIVGRWILVSRHFTDAAAQKAALIASRAWPQVKVEAES